MERITNKDLEYLVNRINEVTNSPKESYTKNETTGRYQSNVGNYNIYGAYGGVSLHRIVNESGGIKDVFSCGCVPKRELYNRMQSFLSGLSA